MSTVQKVTTILTILLALSYTLQAQPNAQIPTEFAILNVYPNPFNSTARIDFNLPSNGDVTLRMMDLNGRIVSSLYEKWLTAGKHSIDINGLDQPAGLYFIQLMSRSDVTVSKVVLLK
jgi:hypothetical protein